MKHYALNYFSVFLLSALMASPVTANEAPIADADVQALIAELGLRESTTAVRDMPGWQAPRKIVVRAPESFDLAKGQQGAPGVEIVFVDNRDDAAREAADAQAVIGLCDQELLAGAPGLHWVQVYSSGVERCVVLPAIENGDRLLTNGQKIGSPALAEHAIAMMMTLARGLDVYHRNQLDGKWIRNPGLSRVDHLELEGRTLLVVGLGGIGTQVAKRGHGLGMRVIATRGSRREGPEYVDYVGLSPDHQAQYGYYLSKIHG